MMVMLVQGKMAGKVGGTSRGVGSELVSLPKPAQAAQKAAQSADARGLDTGLRNLCGLRIASVFICFYWFGLGFWDVKLA